MLIRESKLKRIENALDGKTNSTIKIKWTFKEWKYITLIETARETRIIKVHWVKPSEWLYIIQSINQFNTDMLDKFRFKLEEWNL